MMPSSAQGAIGLPAVFAFLTRFRQAAVRRLLVGLVLPAVALAACMRPPSAGDLDPTVVLISLDGFRWDYVDRYPTPTLDRLATEGVHAEKLIPIFPTKTFPNHYSAVTGLYAEHHGIVSNTMYDPAMDAHFSLMNREAMTDPRWWQGEPIWVTAEKQGQVAATYFWPGSEAPIQGVRPTHWFEYDAGIAGEERVDQVLTWLELPRDERPTFLTLYFSGVDGAGHRYGPDSPEVGEAVEQVDGILGRLVDGLERRSLLDRVHLIVISDHGMAETSPERVVILDLYFNPAAATIVDYSPVLMMYPDAEREAETFGSLQTHPHLDVYHKEELPAHYRLDHPRTPPLIAVAEPGWSISTREQIAQDPGRFRGGTHGYDNRSPSMGGLFIARGPAFKRGQHVAPVEIIHLYALMCGILGLEPAPNDGRIEAVNHLLTGKTSLQHVEN